MGSLRLAGLALLALGSSSLLFSCGGGDSGNSPTPPVDTGQTVLVQVTTTGENIDPDGYTVRLGTRSASVQSTGTATFDDVSAGSYQVSLEGVAPNCSIQGAPTASVTVTASSGAQATFTIVCVVDFGDGLATVACTSLSPAATSGVPLDRIAAGSVPSALDPPLAARVLTPDGAFSGYAWFEVNAEDELELVTPLYPNGALEGGEVLIRATDGNVACEPFEFTIDPLPTSPGELGAVVDQFQDILRAQAAVLETTPEALMATPIENVSGVLLPMAIIQYSLDHPGNDRSFRRIAEGTSPMEVPLDLVDALLARVDLGEGIENQGPASPRVPGASASVDPETCSPDEIGSNAERLNDCMNAAEDVDAVLEALADKVGPLLSAALVAKGAVSATGAPSVVLSGIAWAAVQQEVRVAAALPRHLDDVTIGADPERFTEDDPRTGAWTAVVGARSDGWDLTVSLLEYQFLESTTVGLEKVGFSFEEVFSDLAPIIDEIGDLLQDDMGIPSQFFGPVLIDDQQWSQVDYSGGSIEEVEHNSYKPIAVGQTILRLRVPPGGGELKFGGSEEAGNHPLDVDEIKIKVEPQDIMLEPGEHTTFQVTVENAHSPELIDEGAAEGETLQGVLDGLLFKADGSVELGYTAPPAPDFDDPDRIQVRSIATTGARAVEGAPPRFGTANIRFGKIRIEPRPFCVDPSEEIDFMAEVEGPDDESVTWTATGGTIDQSGHYEAPAGGSATVRATSNAESDLVDEVTFSIGCTCTYGLVIGLDVVNAEPGDVLSFVSAGPDDRLSGVTVRRPSELWEAFVIPLGDPLTWPDGPGSWPVRVQGDMGLTKPTDIIWAKDVLIDLEVYEPRNQIKGLVFGAMVDVASTEDPKPLPFTWGFEIRLQPGQLQCTVPDPGGV